MIFYFEDVILHRNNPHERLGLTLCYGISSKSRTNIYIEEVIENLFKIFNRLNKSVNRLKKKVLLIVKENLNVVIKLLK